MNVTSQIVDDVLSGKEYQARKEKAQRDNITKFCFSMASIGFMFTGIILEAWVVSYGWNTFVSSVMGFPGMPMIVAIAVGAMYSMIPVTNSRQAAVLLRKQKDTTIQHVRDDCKLHFWYCITRPLFCLLVLWVAHFFV